VAVQGPGFTPLSLSVLVALPVERRISLRSRSDMSGSSPWGLASTVWRAVCLTPERRSLKDRQNSGWNKA